jgi:multidrug efflux pump
VLVNGPEGASFGYMEEYMDEIERRLLPYAESGEAIRVLMRTPRGFGAGEVYNTGIVIMVMAPFGERRSSFVVMDEIRAKLSDLPGVRAFPVMRQGFGAASKNRCNSSSAAAPMRSWPQWRDRLLAEIDKSNPGLIGIDWDYKETKPQLRVEIDYDRAADLGVTVGTIGRTLETMLGSRKVTTYIDAGEEYDLILEGERDIQRTPASLQKIYVRSPAVAS